MNSSGKSKKSTGSFSRRDFFQSSILGSACLMTSPFSMAGTSQVSMAGRSRHDTGNPALSAPKGLDETYTPLIDLTPARWIWYPSERTLQNSVFLFRETVMLDELPQSAVGWIFADSRYRLRVNGQYVQFGPAPSDPRRPEADPLDITRCLKAGENTIAVEVLYFGTGEGTWPTGKPGFIMNLNMDYGTRQSRLVTDRSWRVCLGDSWPPGQYKRWYLRAFQEEFDARRYPYGWDRNGFEETDGWMAAMEINLPADKPPIASPYEEYQQEIRANPDDCDIRERSIPHMKEQEVIGAKPADRFGVRWTGNPDRYFEFLTPGLYHPATLTDFEMQGDNRFSFSIEPPQAAVLTFELEEQVVGWPRFVVDAPEGTIVELMVQEGHETGNQIIMNNRLHSWTRFICREGRNEFETFDYESLRWIQLHIRGKPGKVTVGDVAVRRRISGWDALPRIETSDPAVNRVLSATINTLCNSAQDLLVDGMGRERQQYSGDVGHQVHCLFSVFGDVHLPKRYINTYSQGITLEGYFMDSWPAYDRLARIAQRQLGLTMWGPIIDHGVGFVLDCYYHYLYSGNLRAMQEVYPRLLRFFNYVVSLMDDDGLLPVEDLGVTWVWMDTDIYTRQRHKQCSFNLYAAAMMMRGLAPLARAFGDDENAENITSTGRMIHEKTVERFWDGTRQLFVDNRPWLSEEGSIRLSDRSLAMALIYDLIPGDNRDAVIEALAHPPEGMGLSFPANAVWRLWALGKAGRPDSIIDEITGRWYNMDSVQLNNTLQEHWSIQPDTRGQWSHCAVGPLFAAYQGLAGITPLEPGQGRVQIKPKPGRLEKLNLKYHTPSGEIAFSCTGSRGDRTLEIALPEGCEAILVVDRREEPGPGVESAEPDHSDRDHSAYRLEAGQSYRMALQFT